MASPRKRSPKQRVGRDAVFGALIDTSHGGISLIEPGAPLFSDIALALLGPKMHDRGYAQFSIPSSSERRLDSGAYGLRSPFVKGPKGRFGTTAYQWLTGTVLPSLRQRLLPDPRDFVSIVDRIDFYREHIPWVNRGLVIRSGLNAAEFRIDSPGTTEAAREQQEWMLGLKRDLRMFGFMREFFNCLRAYGQVIPLWKTAKGGRDPISIECANPQVYQPRFNPLSGARPRIVVVPANDEQIRRLAEEARGSNQTRRAEAERRLAEYPEPLRQAVLDSNDRMSPDYRAEVPSEDLERYGYHFEYASLDRRHWDDWGFPGMYSIFPYLEMLMLADDSDINALHHYKAGILLVRLGPSEPRAGDESLIAGESELRAIDRKLVEMAKSRLPGWAARGDLRIDWIVPPDHIMNPQKVASSKEKVLDWLGIPKIAWAGQDIQGAFASSLVSLKFLQQESEDERGIAKELFEEWFYLRAKASNAFEGAVWPIVRFDPNVLLDPRVILDMMRLFMQYGGADEQTIAEMFGYDAEVWLARHLQMGDLKEKYGADFSPEYVPQRGGGFGDPAGRAPGRPATVAQPTPEGGGQQQPRPSVGQAADVAERHFGISRAAFEEALRAEVVTEE